MGPKETITNVMGKKMESSVVDWNVSVLNDNQSAPTLKLGKVKNFTHVLVQHLGGLTSHWAHFPLQKRLIIGQFWRK